VSWGCAAVVCCALSWACVVRSCAGT